MWWSLLTMSLAAVILVIAVLLTIALAMLLTTDGNASLLFLALGIGAEIFTLIIAFFILIVSDAPEAIPGVLNFFYYFVTVVVLGLLLFQCMKCMGTRQASGNQVAIR